MLGKAGQAAGHRLPFAVLDAATGEVLGSTSYHDIVPAIERLEIGYTWYARRVQRTAVNTTAKLLLLSHAFDTLGAALVGWRTDNFNHASQRAIERLQREPRAALQAASSGPPGTAPAPPAAAASRAASNGRGPPA